MMMFRTVLLVLLILAAAGAGATAAKADGSDNIMGQQLQNENQAREQLQDQSESQLRDRISEQFENRTQAQSRTQEQITDQVRLQNQTRVMNVTLLHQQLQERKQEMDLEQAQLSPNQKRVVAGYSNVSAFVHLLLNESQTRALLGEGPVGIGPQVSAYAREFNNSLRAQIQEEERITSRNALVRFFAGGDKEAGGVLEQETVRNQERIQQMQQLIAQCQDCDAQIRELLQNQLQEMNQQQTRLQQVAQRELRDKGIIGWLWK
jgi:hypothetical protein